MMAGRAPQTGYSVVELLVSMVIAAMLLAGLHQVLGVGLLALDVVDGRTDLIRQGRFAMSRMVDAVRDGNRLLIPLADNPATNFSESVREQTVPATPPQGSSLLATAVLAVTMSRSQDLDADGVPDADNDGDGRFDEDLPADNQNDGRSGVRGVDDDGNGIVDFWLAPAGDDDESSDLRQSEDPLNGYDDDGDGSIDEDPGADTNGDGAPGVAGLDDDEDGVIDEGDARDDDEDGLSDEDWYDPVVFFLRGSSVIERRPVPWDTNGDSVVNGRDFVESVLTDNVTRLRFERVASTSGEVQMVDITLGLASPDGGVLSLNTRVRLRTSR